MKLLTAVVASLCFSALALADGEESESFKQFRALYASDAAEYEIYRDRDHREKLELREQPVHIWTNAIRRQHGSVFVWTWKGRPEAIGSIFTFPAQDKTARGMMHEFHSLSESILVPVREGENRWEPKAGLKLKAFPDAPIPAATARQRMLQMRELIRGFAARSIDTEKQTWELRLLTQPLYRYESPDLKIIDGALFAYVTSAGTDPEVVVVLEARQTETGKEWVYAVCRFSNSDLYVKYGEKEVWASILGGDNTRQNDPQHLYRLMRERFVSVTEADTPVPSEKLPEAN